jgi:hypothetical protein
MKTALCIVVVGVFYLVVMLFGWCLMKVAGDADERAEHFLPDTERIPEEQEELKAAPDVRKEKTIGAQ